MGATVEGRWEGAHSTPARSDPLEEVLEELLTGEGGAMGLGLGELDELGQSVTNELRARGEGAVDSDGADEVSSAGECFGVLGRVRVDPRGLGLGEDLRAADLVRQEAGLDLTPPLRDPGIVGEGLSDGTQRVQRVLQVAAPEASKGAFLQGSSFSGSHSPLLKREGARVA